MKTKLFVSLLISSLFLIGCGSNMADTPRSAWDALMAAAKNNDCPDFQKYVTSRLEVDEFDCEKAFKAIGAEAPTIAWEKTKTVNDTESKVFLSNGRSLTTFIKNADGVWQVDTKFWR